MCGLLRVDIQRHLFSEDKNLTFQRAVDRATALEAALANATAAHSKPESEFGMNQLPSRGTTKCFRCNSTHLANSCPHVNATCFFCNKKGHIQKACLRRQGKLQPKRKRTAQNVRVLQPSESPLRSVATKEVDTGEPIMLSLIVEGVPLQMELDTGAAVSVMSLGQFRSLFPTVPLKETKLTLRTYTSEPVKPCGVCFLRIEHNDQCQRLPLYVLPQSGPALFGRNWLQQVRIDWSQVRGLQQLQCERSLSAQRLPELQSLLDRHKDLFKNELGTIRGEKATLVFKDGKTPKFFKARSVPFSLKSTVEQELSRQEQMGILTSVTSSEYATPVVPVLKRDGSIRVCGDYKLTLNPILDVEHYPLPKPDELFAALAGGQQFSKIDLNRAYQQVKKDEESKRYLTLNTHKGLYAVNRLPFGIASAPAIFQKIMDNVLKGLDFVFCYIDDILITGRSKEEHLRNLDAVLKRLSERGIRVKPSKCEFFRDELTYLGHVINKHGIHPTDEKLAAITNAPAPTDKHQLQSLLGLINYYGKFVPNLSTVLFPLNRLLQKDAAWDWDTACDRAFQHIKQLLSSAPILAHYDPSLPLQLSCDASAYGVGAVLSHIFSDGQIRPIAYASRTLSRAEKGYSQLEKEALALVFGVKKFHYYVYARHFVLLTDHKPLATIFGPKTGIPAIAAARLQRWAVGLSAYSFSLKFRPSTQNADADCLSRLPITQSMVEEQEESFFDLRFDTMPINSNDIARETSRDATLRTVTHHILSGWPRSVPDEIKPFFHRRLELSIHRGCIMLGMRVLVPEKFRTFILDELHQGHPGVVRTKELARSYVWWPTIDSDIERFTASCTDCAANRNLPPKAPLHPWAWPTRPWQRLHVDFAGPINGVTYLVVVDAHSKWPEVFPMRTTTTEATISCLHELFCRFGFPETLVSDNGTQFTSADFQEYLQRVGTRHVRTAPYHPSSNGLAERFVQTLKGALRKSSRPTSPSELADFLLSYRNTPQATTAEAPSILLLGRRLRARLDLIRPSVEERVARKQFQDTSRRRHRATTFSEGDFVRVRNFRRGPRWFSATVLARTGPVSYRVSVVTPRGVCEWVRHRNHIVRAPDSDDTVITATDFQDEDVTAGTDTSSSSSSSTTEPVEQPPTHLEAAEQGRRYPLRQRRPPDRYGT